MKTSINWKNSSQHWPIILIGVFLFISFSALVAKRLNQNTSLENALIFQTGPSSEITLRPLNFDSLGVATNSAFVLRSSAKLNKDQLYASLKFSPDIDYQLSYRDGAWLVTFDRPLQNNEIVRATLATYRGNNLASSSREVLGWAYQAKSPLAVTSSEPADRSTAVPLGSNIIIRLSHDNFFNLNENVTIEPATPGTFSHKGRNIIFTPAQKLLPGTLYTVTVKKSLPFHRSTDRLANNHVFRFETSLATSAEYLAPASNLLQFYENEKPVLQLASTASPNLSVVVYAYDSAAGFISDLAANELPWWTRNQALTKIKMLRGREIFQFKQPITQGLIEFPVALSSGYYLAKLSSQDSTQYKWLQVSNISAFNILDYDKFLVWVNSAEGVIKNATLRFFGSDDQFQTNDQGIALFNTPKTIQAMLNNPNHRRQSYLIINNDDQELILPIFNFSSYKFTETPNTADEHEHHWQFNQKTYRTNNPIHIDGEIKNRTASTSPTVTYAVYRVPVTTNYYGHPLTAVSGGIELHNGKLALTLPAKSFLPGTYEFNVYTDSKYLNRSYFEVSACAQPDNNNSASDVPTIQNQDGTYAVGDTIKVAMALNGQPITASTSNNFLYLKYQAGFKWYEKSGNNTYQTIFTQDLAPNFSLFAVYYDHYRYRVAEINPTLPINYPTYEHIKPITSGAWSLNASRLENNESTFAAELAVELGDAATTAPECRQMISAPINKLGTTSQINIYQLPDGGLSLQSGELSNLELSSLIALTSTTTPFDQTALTAYFLNILESPTAKNIDMSLAMSGLVGLSEPLLNRISSWVEYRADLNHKERYYIEMALGRLGAYEWQKNFKNTSK